MYVSKAVPVIVHFSNCVYYNLLELLDLLDPLDFLDILDLLDLLDILDILDLLDLEQYIIAKEPSININYTTVN